MAKKKTNPAPTIENRRARHEYEILETLECGVALQGSEVKSVRDGKVSLAEGYVRLQQTPPALFLHSVNIAEYGPAGPTAHQPTRTRTLLAHKREIDKLARQVEQKGMTLVPLKIYFKDGRAKVLVGLGRGRQAHDKREAISQRETKREMDRALSKKLR
ncbi:MAG TPA: SsrA-binding protein SmpB [Phycisphaerales bacterium]|nr:SsrA-binding protein SmpB [Phycisphaerales bacterium]